MDKFNATKVNIEKGIIQVSSVEELEQLYNVVSNGNSDFILTWIDEDGIEKSQVVMVDHISAKVRNGDVLLTSTNKTEE